MCHKMKEVNYTRHTCIICGKKRYEHNMKNVFASSWACTKNDFFFIINTCSDSSEIVTALLIIQNLKSLKRIKLSHLSSAENVRPELTFSQAKNEKGNIKK